MATSKARSSLLRPLLSKGLILFVLLAGIGTLTGFVLSSGGTKEGRRPDIIFGKVG